MVRESLNRSTFDLGLERLLELYLEGHEVVVSSSGGKDSTVITELAILAARAAGRLPVKVVMRDEEIMFPGTFEYCERVAARPEVDFYWLIGGQPVVNCFSRSAPYFWVFDRSIPPEAWVRRPPEIAEWIQENSIQAIANPNRFPPPPGKGLFVVLGLRAAESVNRRKGIFSSGGHRTKETAWGYFKTRPIYDWSDADVWRAIKVNGWDYNEAYDVLFRLGVPGRKLRIAPPTLQPASIELLQVAARAWPKWFDRVANRLDGVRAAARYGRHSVEPIRRSDETWQSCFERECIELAPEWIAARAREAARRFVARHRNHASTEFPEVKGCIRCGQHIASWRLLSNAMYMGDPFSLKGHGLPEIEPEFFRPGAGTWGGGKPTW